ncbi:MAG: SPOR domain-containing protein [Pararhodobacter sp.]
MAQGYFEGRQPPHVGRIEPVLQAARNTAPAGAAPVAESAAGRVARLVNFTGAVMSVALLAGVGIWSYKLMVRDVTGVPVIRALAGPMRVSPEDPGGRQAAYQGLAVNTVAAEGGAGAAPQEIALAPQPVDLQSEDHPTAVLARSAAPINAPDQVAQVQPASQASAIMAAVHALPQMDLADEPPTQGFVTEMAAVQPDFQILPSSVPGIARSPVPPRRSATQVAARISQPPVQTAALAVPAAAPAAVPGRGDQQAEALLQELVTRLGAPRVTDVDPASLRPGTRLVQLGVYDDEGAARAAWDRITQRFPAFLENRGRIVEPAASGGRVFYRLRADGFADEPEARRFCSMLGAENIDCIPTLIR